MRILVVCMAACVASGASAQTPQHVSAAAFARDPGHFLNQRIRVDDFACWNLEGAYRCESGKELDVIPLDISPAAVKQKIVEECGGNDGVERTPGCVFDLVFTPTSLAKGPGNIIRNEVVSTGPIWIVQTGSVSAIPRR
jgi:hypothetical protein